MGIIEKTARMRKEGRDVDEIALAIRSHRRRKTFMKWTGVVAAGAMLGIGLEVGKEYIGSHNINFGGILHRVQETPAETEETAMDSPHKETQAETAVKSPVVIEYNGVDDHRRVWVTKPSIGYKICGATLSGEATIYTRDRVDSYVGGIDRIVEFRIQLLTGRIRDQTYFVEADCKKLSNKIEARRLSGFPYVFSTYQGGQMQLELTSDTFFGVSDGKIVWKTRNGTGEIDVLTGKETEGTGKSAVYANLLFLRSSTYTIDVIHLETGALMWRKTPMPYSMKVRVEEGRVIIEHDHGVMLLDKTTGNRIVEFKMSHENGQWLFVGEDCERYYIRNDSVLVAFEK